MNLETLDLKAGAAEGFLKAVANRQRLMILCELLQGERSGGGAAEGVGLSQSALSQHLARLREDELVATRREVADDLLFARRRRRETRLIGMLYEIYCSPAEASALCDAPTTMSRGKM